MLFRRGQERKDFVRNNGVQNENQLTSNVSVLIKPFLCNKKLLSGRHDAYSQFVGLQTCLRKFLNSWKFANLSEIRYRIKQIKRETRKLKSAWNKQRGLICMFCRTHGFEIFTWNPWFLYKSFFLILTNNVVNTNPELSKNQWVVWNPLSPCQKNPLKIRLLWINDNWNHVKQGSLIHIK